MSERPAIVVVTPAPVLGPTEKFLKLCIWDNPYLTEVGIAPKIPLKYRLLHAYLQKTQPKLDSRMIKLLGKVLKRVYGF